MKIRQNDNNMIIMIIMTSGVKKCRVYESNLTV